MRRLERSLLVTLALAMLTMCVAHAIELPRPVATSPIAVMIGIGLDPTVFEIELPTIPSHCNWTGVDLQVTSDPNDWNNLVVDQQYGATTRFEVWTLKTNTKYYWSARLRGSCMVGTETIVGTSEWMSAVPFTTGETCHCGGEVRWDWPHTPDAEHMTTPKSLPIELDYHDAAAFDLEDIDYLEYQIATDRSFQNIVHEIRSGGIHEVPVSNGSIMPGRRYWWRVRGVCICSLPSTMTRWTGGVPITVAGPGLVPSGNISLTTWNVPSPPSHPGGIDVDDGIAVFVETTGDKVGHLNVVTNEITEWSIGDHPMDIVAGTTIQYTERFGNAIGRLDMTSNSREYQTIPTSGAGPGSIALSSVTISHGTWITCTDVGMIVHLRGTPSLPASASAPRTTTTVSPTLLTRQSFTPTEMRVTPVRSTPTVSGVIHINLTPKTTGYVTEYVIPSSAGTPRDIAAAPDGSLWMTTLDRSLLRFDPNYNVLTIIPLPMGSTSVDIAVDSSGFVWFAEGWKDRIGMYNPSTGELFEWDLAPGSQPVGIAVHPNGTVWFAERSGNRIGGLFPADVAGSASTPYPANLIREYPLTGDAAPVGIAIDETLGHIWFTAERTHQVGRLIPW